jgi:hypothetical protein
VLGGGVGDNMTCTAHYTVCRPRKSSEVKTANEPACKRGEQMDLHASMETRPKARQSMESSTAVVATSSGEA